MIESILCRIPAPIRDSVVQLAAFMTEAAVHSVKNELIQLCQSHPELTAEQISLIVAQSLHSNSPLAIEDSPPISSVNPSIFTSGSEEAA